MEIFLQSIRTSHSRGFSFIEVLVATSIMLVVFVGFFGAYKVSADVSWSAKARLSASALATDRIEYIRSLSFGDVGIVGGNPSGTLLSSEDVTENNIPFNIQTDVVYIDEPANGAGVDYKSVRVKVTWTFREIVQSVSEITYIAP